MAQNTDKTDATTTAAETTGRKKKQRTEVVYVYPDGAEKKAHDPEAIGARLTILNSEGKPHGDIKIMLDDFPQEHIPGYALTGLLVKLRGAGGNKEAEEAFTATETMLEEMQGGEFIARAEGKGPLPSMLLQAFVMAVAEQHGEKVEDITGNSERLNKIREHLKSPETRKAEMQRPKVALYYKQLSLEAAQKRLERLAADIDKGKAKAPDELKGVDLGGF